MPPNPARPGANLRTADRLLAEGRIRRDQYEAAIGYAKRMSCPIEDALIEVDAIGELELLKYLAGALRTRFVSTEKLSKAVIDRSTLEKIPRKVAERYGVVPVVFDPAANSLVIVTADPENVEALDNVRKAAGVREVKALVGRPAAVRAAVRKLYLGESYAFSALETRVFHVSGAGAGHGSATLERGAFVPDLEPGGPGLGGASHGVGVPGTGAAAARAAASSSAPPVLEIPAPPRAPAAVPSARAAASSGEALTIADVYLETLNVLVSQLDIQRPGLRGHSGVVARLVRKLAERMGVPDGEVSALVVAAYLHDLGRNERSQDSAPLHLTALNVAESDEHRAAALKSVAIPRRLMESVPLAPSTLAALDSFFERFDGHGIPGHQTGKDIPLGSRLLALADSFAELTQNPLNRRGRVLSAVEACEALAAYKETIFDPQLFDLFRAMVAGDDLRARLRADRHLVLVVDPDREATTALELRMAEEGFDMRAAADFAEALAVLETGGVELVVSEIDLGQPGHDGIELLSAARQHGWGRDLPWLIVTRHKGRAEAQRAFELGVVDYVIKPTATEMLVAKVRRALERRPHPKPARGVSGSLEEMALPDLVQVLWHGRKTGALRVRHDAREGEIHFLEGTIVDAVWGDLRAEEAFYAIVKLAKGEFALDPNFRPEAAAAIRVSPEALLLEGMRRMDEGL